MNRQQSLAHHQWAVQQKAQLLTQTRDGLFDMIGNALDDAKDEWDFAVCNQLCGFVEGMENTVDAECPDEPCMAAHPEWKHFEPVDVQDAAAAAMEELGMIAQTHAPNQPPMGPMPQPVMIQARPPNQNLQRAPRPMPMQPQPMYGPAPQPAIPPQMNYPMSMQQPVLGQGARPVAHRRQNAVPARMSVSIDYAPQPQMIPMRPIAQPVQQAQQAPMMAMPPVPQPPAMQTMQQPMPMNAYAPQPRPVPMQQQGIPMPQQQMMPMPMQQQQPMSQPMGRPMKRQMAPRMDQFSYRGQPVTVPGPKTLQKRGKPLPPNRFPQQITQQQADQPAMDAMLPQAFMQAPEMVDQQQPMYEMQQPMPQEQQAFPVVAPSPVEPVATANTGATPAAAANSNQVQLNQQAQLQILQGLPQVTEQPRQMQQTPPQQTVQVAKPVAPAAPAVAAPLPVSTPTVPQVSADAFAQVGQDKSKEQVLKLNNNTSVVVNGTTLVPFCVQWLANQKAYEQDLIAKALAARDHNQTVQLSQLGGSSALMVNGKHAQALVVKEKHSSRSKSNSLAQKFSHKTNNEMMSMIDSLDEVDSLGPLNALQVQLKEDNMAGNAGKLVEKLDKKRSAEKTKSK